MHGPLNVKKNVFCNFMYSIVIPAFSISYTNTLKYFFFEIFLRNEQACLTPERGVEKLRKKGNECMCIMLPDFKKTLSSLFVLEMFIS